MGSSASNKKASPFKFGQESIAEEKKLQAVIKSQPGQQNESELVRIVNLYL